MPDPVRLTPSLRERVWGRTRLAPWFPDVADPKKPIGEAWYLADQDLPLLVKLIFTSERLSVQVHPDDGEDGPRGKLCGMRRLPDRKLWRRVWPESGHG